MDASVVSLPDLALPFVKEALRRRLVAAATEHGMLDLSFCLSPALAKAAALLCMLHPVPSSCKREGHYVQHQGPSMREA